ncbi:hypothetical protein [Porphyromonas sp.]
MGNLYNDPDKKLRKYLEGGRIEKSVEWTFKYDKDRQLIEKFRGKAGFFSAKKDCWEYSWNQNGTSRAYLPLIVMDTGQALPMMPWDVA